MRKAVLIFLAVLLVGLFAACYQDVTVDTDVYYEMEMGTFTLNGKSYATLQDAVNALNAGKAVGDNVIYLNKNAKGPGAVINNNNVVIDFGGHTFDFTNVSGLQGILGGDFGLTISQGSDVTLRGLEQVTLDDSFSTDLTMIFIEGNDTTLRIEKAPKLVVADDQYVFWAANGASLIIGEQESESSVNIAGAVAATGGESEESKPTIIIQGNSKAQSIEVSNSTVFVSDSSVVSGNLTAKDSSNVVISTDDGVTQKIAKMDKDAGSSVTVASGAIKVDSLAEESDGEIVTVGTGSVSPESASGVTPVPDTTTVAMIGAEKYTNATLAGAIDNLEDNTRTVVKIVNNANTNVLIHGNKNVALDLSKYTLTGNITVEDGGALEIKGTVDDTAASGKLDGLLTVNENAELSIISGFFTSDPSAYIVGYSSVEGTSPFKVTVNTSGAASIQRGSKEYFFKIPDKAFGFVEEGETINILESCSVSSDVILEPDNISILLNGNTLDLGSCVLLISGDNSLVQNGAIQTTGNYAITVGDAEKVVLDTVAITGGLNVTNNSSVTVKGLDNTSVTGTGEFTVQSQHNSVIFLEGGSYTSTNDMFFNEVSGGKIVVKGGDYSHDPSPYYYGIYAIKYDGGRWFVENPEYPHTINADTTVLKHGYTYNVDGPDPITLGVRLTIDEAGEAVLYLKEDSVLNIPKGFEVGEGQSLVIKGVGTINIEGEGILEGPGLGGAGNIIIEGGNVNINGLASGAGISGATVSIKGGSVNATGGAGAGGFGICGTNVSITGGGITAAGGSDGVSGVAATASLSVAVTNARTKETADAAWVDYTSGNSLRYFQTPTLITSNTTTLEEDTIYILDGKETDIDSVINVTGNATIILTDGKTLNANKGIIISDGKTLTLKTPGEPDKGTGTLVATGKSGHAGIEAGTVRLEGGYVITEGAPGHSGISADIQLADSYKLEVRSDTASDWVEYNGSNPAKYMRTMTAIDLIGYLGLTEKTGDYYVYPNALALTEGKYIISDNFKMPNYRVIVSGEVTIDVAEGKTMWIPKGFYVPDGSAFVYEGPGTLLIDNVTSCCAAIGGVEDEYKYVPVGIKDAGTITINGGIITVKGGDYSAGIGGGYSGKGGNITINGGTVNATGGSGAAGIGSGGYGSNYSGGIITIGGGTVTANGGSNGAGIGGGYGANSGIIKISGGTVKAYGVSDAAGIGGGVASGSGASFDGGKCDITISGGSVTAVGGSNAAGIGNGRGRNTGTITITGGTVNATGGNEGPGIGGGFIQHKTVDETLTIEIGGGDVTAIGGIRGAGIGTAYFNGGVAGVGSVSITGGTVTATGGAGKYSGDYGGAGIGTGYSNASTFGEGVVLTISGSNTQVTATGKDGAAGIGGAVNQNGGTITINGGTVTATGAEGASGIGKGKDGTEEGTLTVADGTVLFGSTVNDDDNTKNNWHILTGDSRNQFMKSGKPVVSVTISQNQAITVSGPLTYTVSPEEPTNKTFTWEIVSGGTGAATINSATGEITNVSTSGNVNVKATANDGSGKTNTCSVSVSAGTPVQDVLTSTYHTLTSGVYIINSNYSHDYRITVSGNVTLILSDGTTFTAPKGFYVGTGNSFTIEGTGSLTVNNVDADLAGIGGNQNTSDTDIKGNSGSITIKGGTINVTGGENAAGIGGGFGGNSGVITISGGTVNASAVTSGAGIGGGRRSYSYYDSSFHYYGGTFGNINISGGTVYATGGQNGAGIGRGVGNVDSINDEPCGTITISGGNVTAKGGYYPTTGVYTDGAGIGGGVYGSGVDVVITGGTVVAMAGTSIGNYWPFGIGKGASSETMAKGTLKITDKNTLQIGPSIDRLTPIDKNNTNFDISGNTYSYKYSENANPHTDASNNYMVMKITTSL